MITEDYVSFEVAKLLKEKGFDEPCQFLYFSKYKQEGDFVGNFNARKNSEINEESYSAPTHQMAMKWLREVHNIFIVIEPHMYDYINEKNASYVFSLWQGDNYYENPLLKDFPYYEEVVEAALKYSLENLL